MPSNACPTKLSKKSFFQSHAARAEGLFPCIEIIPPPFSRLGWLIQPPEGMDFADIVNHRIQSPLHIHLGFGAERKAVHVLVETDVGKDRLDNFQPLGVDFPAGRRVNFYDEALSFGIVRLMTISGRSWRLGF
ncbi:MAG: hypothetical protein ACOYYF_15980 [Chloroflexota bacterium]